MRSFLCTGNCNAGLQSCKIRIQMVEAILEQCFHETETYVRTLQYLTNENIGLKNRLAAIVQRSINPEFLENAELFNNKFVAEDEAVKIMRHEVKRHEELLNIRNVHDDNGIHNIQKLQVRLRRDMEGVETGFNKIRFDFYHYLGEYLGLAADMI